MVQSAMSALNEVDAVLFMINAAEKRGAGDNFIIDRLKGIKAPVYLLINKIDQIHPDDLLAIMEQYKTALPWKAVYPISALEGNNVDEFLGDLVDEMPNGPQYYPEDQVTDHPERFVVSELIREKIFMLTREEVPHSVAVEIESMKQKDEDHVHIEATIIVERPTQKGIMIGKGGSMLKKIGTMARRDIEHLLGSKVYLQLWVKVQPNWRDKATLLKRYGYRKDDL